MSQPKRYINGRWGLDPHESGEWVMWSDYAALAAENERLRSASFVTAVPSEEYEKLKAEVEWLRKADRLVCWNEATQEWEIRHEHRREGRDAK